VSSPKPVLGREKALKSLSTREKILLCFQCGTCVGSCPIARVISRYSPRKILEKIILGDEKILTGDLVWLCAYCHTCYERCPQRVGLSHVFMALKNLAANMGNVPDELAKEALQMIRTGWIVPSSPVIDRRRVEMKLPPIPRVNVAEIQEIAKATGFLNLVPEAKKRGGSKGV